MVKEVGADGVESSPDQHGGHDDPEDAFGFLSGVGHPGDCCAQARARRPVARKTCVILPKIAEVFSKLNRQGYGPEKLFSWPKLLRTRWLTALAIRTARTRIVPWHRIRYHIGYPNSHGCVFSADGDLTHRVRLLDAPPQEMHDAWTLSWRSASWPLRRWSAC